MRGRMWNVWGRRKDRRIDEAKLGQAKAELGPKHEQCKEAFMYSEMKSGKGCEKIGG